MANPDIHNDLPQPGNALMPGPDNPDMKVDRYEQIRYLENKFANNLTHALDSRIEDVQSKATTLFRALQGDENARQKIELAAVESGQLLTHGISIDQVQKHLQASMTEMKHAYEKGDLDAMAGLASAAVIATMDPGKKLDMATDLKNLGKIADAADNTADAMHDASMAGKHIHVKPDQAAPWAGDTNPTKEHDPALMHGHRNGPVDIDNVRYEHGKPPEIIVRAPLELEPIDKPIVTTAPRRASATSNESRPTGQEEDHLVRNTAIGIGTMAGLTAAGIAGKQYLENEERKDRTTLSEAYKAATSAPWELSSAERDARFAATLKEHPQLQEALAGYKLVFDSALHSKDGRVSQNDKEILNIVASNTSIEISKGNLDNIKVTSSAFENPKRDVVHEVQQSWDYGFPER